ncbi:hypothetical protein BbuJD1_J03 (plasmid) [Borreliella burgdorferi JD1]|uniref:Uncharacterized protein n=1 Tax=Borreliella burgdorferi 297 TaxID=521009 RepID=A0A9N7ATD7_BORBG|nr:hypothetical protein BbuJD1_J03 [Borreliella burgdorferi JD1]ADQ44552.1 conserved hypothetical protein [Borreliella burgdorferi 297]
MITIFMFSKIQRSTALSFRLESVPFLVKISLQIIAKNNNFLMILKISKKFKTSGLTTIMK